MSTPTTTKGKKEKKKVTMADFVIWGRQGSDKRWKKNGDKHPEPENNIPPTDSHA
jgi:hypothetical protein